MDPVALGIIKPDEILDVPIIRIVMALGGTEPALTYRKTQKAGNFTAYDIWASGLSKDVYPVVSGDVYGWEGLAQVGCGVMRGRRLVGCRR